MFVICLFVIAIILIGRWRHSHKIVCDDGERHTIDMNDFTTQYFSYGIEWQAEIRDQAKFAGKLAPVQLEQLSDSLQSANEFRKTLVAGYNSCAVKKVDFQKYASRFQVLDGLSRQIDKLVAQKDFTASEHRQLQVLVNQYVAVSETIASE